MRKNILTLLFAFTLIASANWEMDFDEMWASASVTVDTDVTSGLVAWWKMDEPSFDGTAGEVKDSSGLNNATSFGGCDTVSGKINRAASYNGTTARIQSETSSAGDFTNNFTILLWVKSISTSATRFVCKRYSTTQYDFFTDNWNAFTVFDGTVSRSSSSIIGINDGQWHHIGFTVSENVVHFHYDGVTQNTGLSVSITHQEELLGIGSFPNAAISPMNGLIDDVRIYNRALSSNEVLQVYNRWK